LPLAALRLDAATLADLAQAGLRRIGDIMMRPRAPVAARCGGFLHRRLDGLLGRIKTPISPGFDAPAYLAERRFLDGVTSLEEIEASILSLALDLSELLIRHGEGARRLQVSLFRVDGGVKQIEAGASQPLREPELIARLFHERIEAASEADGGDPFEAGYGFDVIRLSALEVERRDPRQTGWNDPPGSEDLAALIDRLGARLGVRRIVRLDLQATHAPEFAVAAVPAAHWRGRAAKSTPAADGESERGMFAAAAMPDALPARPIRLLRRPEPIETIACAPDGPPLRFRWRRVLHEVTAFEGPERIAPEWWRSETGFTRDYFRAEDAGGQRFWLFREGLFNSETALPRWFMHGLFA
jgi:protein ImuB